MISSFIISILVSLLVIGVPVGLYLSKKAAFKRIDTLGIIINNISRLDNIKAICKQANKDYVEYFGLDYSIISVKNFTKKEEGDKGRKVNNISSDYSYQNPKKEKFLIKQNLKKWAEESYYDGDQPDILHEIYRTRRQVLASMYYVLDKEITHESFNKEIFWKYEHFNLSRVFTPIFYRVKSNNDENGNLSSKEEDRKDDIIIGVVECGYKHFWAEWKLPKIIQITEDTKDKSVFRSAMFIKIFSFIIRTLLSVIFFFRKGFLLKDLQVFLKIYTDNLAQAYYRALVIDEQQTVIKRIEKYRENTVYKQYTHQVLKTLKEYLDADYGVIIFRTFNDDYLNILDDTYFEPETLKSKVKEEFSRNDKPKKNKVKLEYKDRHDREEINPITNPECYTEAFGITDWVVKNDKPYFTQADSNLELNDPEYIQVLKNEEGICAEMVVPLRRYNEVIGVIIFSSKKTRYFNPLSVEITKVVADELVTLVIQKKRHEAYNELTSPSKVWEEPKQVYEQLMTSLSKFYSSDYVVVWEMKTGKYEITDIEKRKYELFDNKYLYQDGLCNPRNKKLLDSLKEISKDGIKEFDFKEGEISENEFIEKPESKNVKIVYQFDDDEKSITKVVKKMDFHFYLLIRVIIQGKYMAFINVFSKQNIFKNALIDDKKDVIAQKFLIKDKDFLEQVAIKASLSIQNIQMVKAMDEVSDILSSSSSNQEGTLQKIVNAALKASNADIISLYPYKGYDILRGDGVHAGNFSQGFKVNYPPDRTATIAQIVINNDENMLLWNNNNEYLAFIGNANPSLKIDNVRTLGFWAQNNILSSVAMKLEYEEKPLGVMFFNYRTDQNFEEEKDTMQLIQNFSRLAGVQIRNLTLLQNIQQELKHLEDIQVQTRNSVEELKNEKNILEIERLKNEKLLRNLADLAGRASYNLVWQTVNHNIRHLLAQWNHGLELMLDGYYKINVKSKEQKSINAFIDYNKEIDKAIKALLELFSKQGRKKNFNKINNIINEITTIFKPQEQDIEFRIEFQKDIPDLKCALAEFSMVMYNLIKNAVDAVHERDNNDAGWVRIRTEFKDKFYTISVEDNGIGIDTNNFKIIKELGFTTKEEGTGVGLHFIYEIVEQEYEGKVSFRSTVNQGTTFTIRIPEYINYK